MSPQPFVKYGVGVGVQQDKDGVVGGQVGLSSRPVQEQMRQVVEAPHYGVVVAFGGAVAWRKQEVQREGRRERGALKTREERSPSMVFRKLSEEVE